MKSRYIILVITSCLMVSQASADSQTFQFGNPAFNGGPDYSAHILQMEGTEYQRNKIKEDQDRADEEAKQQEIENSLTNKFLENVYSRIYATLSKQLVDAMFAEGAADEGTITLEGTTVQYWKSEDQIRMVITDMDGNVTEVVIPIGSFGF